MKYSVLVIMLVLAVVGFRGLHQRSAGNASGAVRVPTASVCEPTPTPWPPPGGTG